MYGQHFYGRKNVFYHTFMYELLCYVTFFCTNFSQSTHLASQSAGNLLHVGFDGETHTGELVVNRLIADDVLDIFKQLYEASYEIEKIRLIDEYDADDEKSMSDNNSSAFNFRYISYSTKLSKHALGLAVDINTLYNPYVKNVDGRRNVEPANAEKYTDRSIEFPHKIDHDDLCYKVFAEHGFEWGGDW